MAGVTVIAYKEFGDIIRSRRFIILEAVLLLLLLVAVYTPSTGFTGFMVRPQLDASSGAQTSFLQAAGEGFQDIVSFVGPMLGIGLAVSAITGEREKGTMKVLLSQPIFRDNVLNGKFLAVASTIGTAFILAYVFFIGAAVMALGVTPTLDEAFRLLLMVFFSTLYTLAFAAISLLFSVLFRRTTTAVLVALGVFALFIFALPLISTPIANLLVGAAPQPTFVEEAGERVMPDGRVINMTMQVPSEGYREALIEYNQKLDGVTNPIEALSPSYHLSRINSFLQTLRDPQQTFTFRGQMMGDRNFGRVIEGDQIQGPLVTMSTTYSLEEGLQILGVNIAALALYMALPFIAAYLIFTKQEEK